jgi:protein-S-isoprenylcysteine O-methyltransferase Ste14
MINKFLVEKDPFLFGSEMLILFSVALLFIAIIIDFTLFHEKKNTKKEKKSIVETGTMTIFLMLFYTILSSTKNQAVIENSEISRFIAIFGAILVFVGAVCNVFARFTLGANWANHIKIYDNHRLVNKGLYGIVRHPLYSSIILMFFGASLSYSNILSGLSVILIFIPFMYYRAKQEEKLLSDVFPEYVEYSRKTGMFFPKLIGRRE